jgi:hypothetical protein
MEHIELEEVQFTMGTSFHPNKTMYSPNPSEIRYVGYPDEELDQAWEEILWGDRPRRLHNSV